MNGVRLNFTGNLDALKRISSRIRVADTLRTSAPSEGPDRHADAYDPARVPTPPERVRERWNQEARAYYNSRYATRITSIEQEHLNDRYELAPGRTQRQRENWQQMAHHKNWVYPTDHQGT